MNHVDTDSESVILFYFPYDRHRWSWPLWTKLGVYRFGKTYGDEGWTTQPIIAKNWQI